MSWRDEPKAPGPRSNRPKPTLKRYTWSRLHSDLLNNILWTLVGRRAAAPLPLVEAFVVRLEAHANVATPRGFVGDFNVAALAAVWGCEEEQLGRIYALLEHEDIGWINQDHIVTFWSRNPDSDVEEAESRRKKDAERQQRKRERDKKIRAELRLKAGYPQSRDVTRDSVTVTPRAEQIIKKAAAVTADVPSESGDIVEFSQAQAWLRTEGERLVCERMRVLRTRACQLIERWVADCGDIVGLVRFMRGAIAANVVADQFAALMDDQIGRHKRGEEQRALPLAPVMLRRTNG